MKFDIATSIKNKSGIYVITNEYNSKNYIGSAVNLAHRFQNHIRQLLTNTHHSKKLQRSVNKHGIDKFSFRLIELCPSKADLIIREQYWLDFYDSVKKGYNNSPTAGSTLGIKHTEETRRKYAIAQTGRKQSKETIEKRISHYIGSKRTKEQRERMSAAQTGRTQSEETRKKISVYNKGRKPSDETLKKLSVIRRGEGCYLSKPINQYALTGEFLNKWVNSHDVHRQLGLYHKCIRDCARGRQKTAYGFIWKYATE